MPFIVSGPLPLITDMPFLNDGAPLACWFPDWITRRCNQQNGAGLPTMGSSWPPVLPILHSLCNWIFEATEHSHHTYHAPMAEFCLFNYSSVPIAKEPNIHLHSPSRRVHSWESKREESSSIHLEVQNSTAEPILYSCSTWKANQISWVCKTEWKNCKKQILPVVFSHLFSGPG